MRPTSITADRAAARLTVTWDDGSATTTSFKVLSDLCPCELCSNERANTDPLKVIRPRSYELESIVPVGSYAINIMWKGGCHYGIYSWERLQQLAAVEIKMKG
jgi:DUF971 family protein